MSIPTGLSRRRLLQLGLPAAFGIGSRLRAVEPASRRVDVLVIGAGISGLAAAVELARQKYDVLVLEARDRIGGRIWSERSWQDDLTLDLGASWIHGIRGNPISELAQQFKIETFPTDGENQWLYRDGAHEYKNKEQDATEARVKKLLAAVRADRKEGHKTGRPDVSLQAALDRALGPHHDTSLKRLELEFQINNLVEQEYAADGNELSSYYWDQDEIVPGGDVLFPQGYGQITNRLAEGLSMKLDHAVSRIEWNARGAAVETKHGRYEADFAVVTLPLGVLKRGGIEFDPVLPQTKRDAIERMGVGLLNKTWLRFPRQFWPKKADWLGYVGEPKGCWSEYLNAEKFYDQPILMAFNAAGFAKQVENQTDDETVAGMVATLRSMFGSQRVPDPTDSRITRWSADEFACGSYSFMKVGATPRDYDLLAEPLDERLFFAGEHTSRRYPATVHGAYLSGLRAAEQVAARA